MEQSILKYFITASPVQDYRIAGAWQHKATPSIVYQSITEPHNYRQPHSPKRQFRVPNRHMKPAFGLWEAKIPRENFFGYRKNM